MSKRPFPNQIRSWFKSGKDSLEIAIAFNIPESEVVDLLAEARAAKPKFVPSKTSPQRGVVKMALASAAQRKKPVTLPTLSILAPTHEVGK